MKVRPNGAESAKVIKVIETKSLRGIGTDKDPLRNITQYWSFEGEFLAEMDLEHCIPLVKHEAEAIKNSTSFVRED